MNRTLSSIVVFCGSSKGHDPIYTKVARELGWLIAERRITLVYGGGNIGLMGILADEVLDRGGKVIGVIPHFLRKKEVCHEGLTELIVVDSLTERKTKMTELSDGALVLPGAYGTLDELFEMVTLVQLGMDDQPTGILNVNGFYDHLIAQIDRMYQEGFLKEIHKNLIQVSDRIEDLLEKMANTPSASYTGKWVDRKP